MSGLRERLLRHKKPTVSSEQSTEMVEHTAPDAPDVNLTANDTDSSRNQEPAPDHEWASIGAHMEFNEWGSFVMKRRSYETSFQHGRYKLDEIWDQSHRLMSILLPGDVEAEKKGLPHDQLLFLDTETTGLGIGAGNVPFMIGIGFYEQDRFTIEQMFIRHPGEELAMLHYLEQKLKRHPYIVSYNGKTFDWPIIKNRYVLNRMPSEPQISGHLDFLYPSRSLWKHTLPSCRLGKVEEERLHVNRSDDVPGSLAPALYFQYLAERDVSVLKGVFEHNELDILSLAGLAVHFSHVLSGKFQLAEMELEEQYRLGLWLSKVGSAELAEQVLERLTAKLFEPDGEPEAAVEYILPVAEWYKQQHKYEASCRLWLLYVEQKGDKSTASLEPYLELAMHYEHREKCLDLALYYADQAMNKVWQRQSLLRPASKTRKSGRGRNGISDEQRKQQNLAEAIRKRIERLRAKASRGLEPRPKSAKQPSGSKSRNKADGAAEYLMDSLF